MHVPVLTGTYRPIFFTGKVKLLFDASKSTTAFFVSPQKTLGVFPCTHLPGPPVGSDPWQAGGPPPAHQQHWPFQSGCPATVACVVLVVRALATSVQYPMCTDSMCGRVGYMGPMSRRLMSCSVGSAGATAPEQCIPPLTLFSQCLIVAGRECSRTADNQRRRVPLGPRFHCGNR